MTVLSAEARADLVQMLSDEDTRGDISFTLWATTTYIAVRIGTELAFPGKHKGYTYQQYIVTLLHQAFVLPLIGILWACGLATGAAASTFSREGSSWVYLLTGSYMLSDSIVNYSPVSGCVTPPESGPPHFSWSVHTHHLFTFVLCALGTTLPPWLEDEGAFVVAMGEAGSLWITVTLLWPTNVNFIVRFYLFLITRAAGILIAVDIVRQLESSHTQLLFIAMAFGVAYGNWFTLGRMRNNAKAAKAKEPMGSPTKSWPL